MNSLSADTIYSENSSFSSQLNDTSNFELAIALAQQAQNVLNQSPLEAQKLASDAIKTHSRCVLAYEILQKALFLTGETKKSIEVQLIHAQITKKQTDFLNVFPLIFNQFGESTLWLKCINKIFRYSKNDEQREKFYAYLQKDYYRHISQSGKKRIQSYMASNVSDPQKALDLCLEYQKPYIFTKAVQKTDSFDQKAVDFIYQNLGKKSSFYLLKVLSIKLQNTELDIILALSSIEIDEKLFQANVPKIIKYMNSNQNPLFTPLLEKYLNHAVMNYPQIGQKLLEGSSQKHQFLLAKAHFIQGNYRQATQILKEQLKLAKTENNTNLAIISTILMTKILKKLNLNDKIGKFLFDDASDIPNQNQISISILQCCFQMRNQPILADSTVFYFQEDKNLAIFSDVRMRVSLGVFWLQNTSIQHFNLIPELIYAPLIQAVFFLIRKDAYIDSLTINMIKILTPAFHCKGCQKQVNQIQYKDEILETEKSLFFTPQILEIIEILQEVGINNIIIQLLTQFQLNTLHNNVCRKYRVFALLYLAKLIQGSSSCHTKFTNAQIDDFETQFQVLAIQLNQGALIYNDLRNQLGKDYKNYKLLNQMCQIVVKEPTEKQFKNFVRILKRQIIICPDDIFLQKKLLYLKLFTKQKVAENIVLAQKLYDMTCESQFLFIKAYLQARISHQKHTSDFFESVQSSFSIIQQYLRMQEKKGSLDGAQAWCSVATLLWTEFDQIHFAIQIYEALITGKQPRNHADAVLGGALYDIIADDRIKQISAHNLCICYQQVGSFDRALQIRKVWFSRM
eukprot:EST43302.1 Hypothetical protein SS50377_16970 [Spironucleus salmonicida]